MKLIRQALLFYQQSSSDKVYEIDLCEVGPGRYVVNYRFGRRGAALREGSETGSPVTLKEAERVFEKVRSSKIDKGYQEGRSSTSEPRAAAPSAAPAAVTNDARAARVLARLWQVGSGAPARPPARGHRSERKPWPLERAIWRAGELRLAEAVPKLCQLVGSGAHLRDYSIAFALGRCAAAGAQQDAAREALGHLLRSSHDAVRRMAVLSLSVLTAGAEREEMAQGLSERLPAPLARAARSGTVTDLASALRSHLEGAAKDRYDALFTLYLILKPEHRPALLEILRTTPLRGGTFRGLRHLFKAAEFLEDSEVFGLLGHRFEKEAASLRQTGSYGGRYVTSDGRRLRADDVRRGLTDPAGRLAFSEKTRDYLRRRLWRALRRVGRLGDPRYVNLAVGVLLPFVDGDAVPERTTTRWQRGRTETTTIADRWAPYWAFNHILHGASPRHTPDRRKLRFRLLPEGGSARVEPRPGRSPGQARAAVSWSFPRLWQQRPAGLLHLLSESACEAVHLFAARALRDCPLFLAELDSDAAIMLLGRPYEVTAELGFELAQQRYRPGRDAADDPADLPLVLAVASCAFPPGRAQAYRWIDERRARFLADSQFILGLCTNVQADTRAFALRLLRSATLPPGEAEVIIGRLIAYLLCLGEGRGSEARDVGAILLSAFAAPLRTVGVNVVMDLLQHPLREVQEVGGQLLLAHDTGAWAWPEALLLALVLSPFESMRGIGVRFLGQLPDEALRARQRLLVELAGHEKEDLRNAVRPMLRRLAASHRDLGDELALLLSAELLKKERAEGVHRSLLLALREDLAGNLPVLPLHRALELASAASKAAQDLGAQLLLATPAWADELDTLAIVLLGNEELLAVRQACLAMFSRIVPRIKASPEEMIKAVRLLDARWDDTRAAAFQIFRDRFGERELSPGILISICDSVRQDVQRFGRELLSRYFRDEAGAEYLDKLSEHPTAEMQLLVTNYLERFAGGDARRLRQLSPYFLSTLSRVNRGRIAKQRLYDFLEAEGKKSPEAAQLVVELLGRLSASISVEGRARCIEALVAVGRAFPAVPLPLAVKPAALWLPGKEARRGV